MTIKNPTRAALYPRVSRSGKRSDEELERHTLAQQRDYALGYLPRVVELVEDERYKDVNVSGTHSERPGLEALFADVEAGLIDAVVVGYLSRFGRNARELLSNVERLHAAGATFYSAKEHITAAPGHNGTGKLLLTILAGIAEMEADRLAENLADANGRAIANGISVPVPYGYVRENGPGSVLIVDELDDHGPAPADVVRRIFALRLTGMGASAIAKLLTDEGVLSPSAHAAARGRRVKQIGKRWQHNTVQGIVETHTYRGVIPRWQTEPDPESKGKSRRRRRIPGTLELLPAQHVALIDDATWHRAQFAVEPTTRNGRVGGSLLQGLVRCASCSQTMRPSSTGPGRLVYSCRGRNAGCTHPASIMRGPVDDYVEAKVLDALGNGGYGVAVVDASELDELTERLAYAERELKALRDGGDATDPDYWPAVRARRARIDELERKRAELARTAGKRPGPTPQVYATLSVDERRQVLTDLLDAVVIRPAPGRGRMGAIETRVAAIVPAGQSPIELSRSGRPVAPRPFPLVEAD